MDDRPIGVFDSGFGGLTVARALMDLLPDESLVYFGDSARYPYGSRTESEIRDYSEQIVEYLTAVSDVKLVVVACNSAASVSLEFLRYRFDLPIVGVIEPGLRAAAQATRNNKVGVIGTEATIHSGAYPRLAASLRVAAALECVACPGFVEHVERGETSGDEVRSLVELRLSPLRQAGIDTLLLGCTHYPYLAPTISSVIGDDVVLVSSADETAFEVRSLLDATGLWSRTPGKGTHRFLSSGDVEWFIETGRRFLGPELDSADQVELSSERLGQTHAEGDGLPRERRTRGRNRTA